MSIERLTHTSHFPPYMSQPILPVSVYTSEFFFSVDGLVELEDGAGSAEREGDTQRDEKFLSDADDTHEHLGWYVEVVGRMCKRWCARGSGYVRIGM